MKVIDESVSLGLTTASQSPPPSGTGTVVVEVEDVNDVPPRFSRPEWTFEVLEGQSPDHVLGTLTVLDQDISNDFVFQVSRTLYSTPRYCIILKDPLLCSKILYIVPGHCILFHGLVHVPEFCVLS